MADIENRPLAASDTTGHAPSAKRAGHGSRLVQRLLKLPTHAVQSRRQSAHLDAGRSQFGDPTGQVPRAISAAVC
ncbi:hypothetical protein [Streptomyces sp. NBC_01314]|uniref:hypothetical protein n=1 Tax=Streptomyces sp. NBC_01314 TaxID=2903821 RepID=UPI003090D012|nr:hypothetical protein OG622_13505 [Streptomyces sp. NBC_01314]